LSPHNHFTLAMNFPARRGPASLPCPRIIGFDVDESAAGRHVPKADRVRTNSRVNLTHPDQRMPARVPIAEIR
jgi:hypothetical protein